MDAPERGADARDGLPEHIEGVYSVLDRLRAQFPHVAIEGCASGGNRLDFGLLARCTCAYLNDYSHRARSVRAYHNGAAWMLPPRRKYLFVYQHPESDWRTSIRSCFDGTIGVAQKLLDMPTQQRRELREELDFYIQHVRRRLARRSSSRCPTPISDLQNG